VSGALLPHTRGSSELPAARGSATAAAGVVFVAVVPAISVAVRMDTATTVLAGALTERPAGFATSAIVVIVDGMARGSVLLSIS